MCFGYSTPRFHPQLPDHDSVQTAPPRFYVNIARQPYHDSIHEIPYHDSIQNCHTTSPGDDLTPKLPLHSTFPHHDSIQRFFTKLPWEGQWRSNWLVWWRTLTIHVSRRLVVDPLHNFATVLCGTSGCRQGLFMIDFCQCFVNDLLMIC